MPTYTIFAGVNGCGKTSIYKSVYYEENKGEKRINTDEMVARIGSWKDNTLQLKCAREAVKLIKEYIEKGYRATYLGKDITKKVIVSGKVNSEKLFRLRLLRHLRHRMAGKQNASDSHLASVGSRILHGNGKMLPRGHRNDIAGYKGFILDP